MFSNDFFPLNARIARNQDMNRENQPRQHQDKQFCKLAHCNPPLFFKKDVHSEV